MEQKHKNERRHEFAVLIRVLATGNWQLATVLGIMKSSNTY
jgi:hypothetical protein